MIDIGKDLQNAYEEGYKQGRYDEKVETEMSLPQRWVPVSERLPDEEGWYLVTDYIGGVRWIEAVYYYPDDGAVMCWSVQNPIAWMRCPDPYCDADTTGGQI